MLCIFDSLSYSWLLNFHCGLFVENYNLFFDFSCRSSCEMQAVTVPCFLYIPKENTEKFRNQPQSTLTQSGQIQTQNSQLTDGVVSNYNVDKFVRILPKKTNTIQEPFQFIDPAQIGSYYNSMDSNLLQHIATNLNSSDVLTSLQQIISSGQSKSAVTNSSQAHGKGNSMKKKKQKSPKAKKIVYPKESKFEKNMKFVCAKDTQAMLSDEALVSKTLFDLQNKKNKCENAKVGKGKICRHFSPMELTKVDNQNLITNFTQTIDTSTQASEFVHTGIQTNNGDYSMLEVLETSDFSSQCKFPGILSETQDTHFQETAPIDTETQTDDINSWLSCFQQPSNLTDMQTQTQNQQLLDKSVQLDDILSGKTWDTECSIYVRDLNTENDHNIPSLFLSNTDYKQTISTQTLNSEDISFEISERSIADRDIVMPTQNDVGANAGNSFGTQTFFDEEKPDEMHNQQETLSFGTQTGFEDNFLSSSGTQTWEADDVINAKTIETQTAISFADLLDSSFIDEYLSSDRISSTETQTHGTMFEPKELNTAQTQTL